MLTNVDNMLTEKRQKMPDDFQCECGKVFKHRQSLSVHRKKCQIIPAEVCPPVAVQSTENTSENQKDQIIELQKQLLGQKDKTIEVLQSAVESGNLGGNNLSLIHI